MITVRTVAPTAEPVTLDEVKEALRLVDFPDDDLIIAAMITDAREQAEELTRRGFMTQTWQALMDRFPSGDIIPMPRPPLQSVTSIVYTDGDGAAQTLSTDAYQVDTVGARVFLKFNQSWPTTQDVRNAVTITFKVGYASTAAIPQAIKTAITSLVMASYSDEDSYRIAGERILGTYRDLRNFWGF